MRAGVRARPRAGQGLLVEEGGPGGPGEAPSTQEQAPPESRALGVLNPSGALVPRPGQCGGEGRQRRRGGHKRTPPNLEGEKETHSGNTKQTGNPATHPGFARVPS